MWSRKLGSQAVELRKVLTSSVKPHLLGFFVSVRPVSSDLKDFKDFSKNTSASKLWEYVYSQNAYVPTQSPIPPDFLTFQILRTVGNYNRVWLIMPSTATLFPPFFLRLAFLGVKRIGEAVEGILKNSCDACLNRRFVWSANTDTVERWPTMACDCELRPKLRSCSRQTIPGWVQELSSLKCLFSEALQPARVLSGFALWVGSNGECLVQDWQNASP